jgi:hypothetical protein
VQHLIAQGFVDEKAIGAAGPQLGRLSDAFLITRTNIFAAVESGAPVSNMISAYGGIRYESGASRQFSASRRSRASAARRGNPLRYMEIADLLADKVAAPILIWPTTRTGRCRDAGTSTSRRCGSSAREAYLFNYNGEAHGLRQRQNMRDWTRRMSEV